jgi:hypothetical protein
MRSARMLALAAAIATVAAVALAAPWSQSGGGALGDLALAAIGSQPVLHVVTQTPTGTQVVDLGSGDVSPLSQRQEIWYDGALGLERTVVQINDQILSDTLETRQGGYTPNGIVYDCSWIAAHPDEATKLHLSCNASGVNGPAPAAVPRPDPAVDPALAGFIDNYQHALTTGHAHAAGSGVLDGEGVDYLVIQTANGDETVALDRNTHKPLQIETRNGTRVRIAEIEAVPFTASRFKKPSPTEMQREPARGSSSENGPIPATATAIAAAMPNAVWAGPQIKGLPLVRAGRETLQTAFVDPSVSPETGPGIELDYGSLLSNQDLDQSKSFVRIAEAPSRELAYGQGGYGLAAPSTDGVLYEAAVSTAAGQGNAGQQFRGTVVSGGVYITLTASTADLLLQSARELQAAAP